MRPASFFTSPALVNSCGGYKVKFLCSIGEYEKGYVEQGMNSWEQYLSLNLFYALILSAALEMQKGTNNVLQKNLSVYLRDDRFCLFAVTLATISTIQAIFSVGETGTMQENSDLRFLQAKVNKQ